MHAISFHHVCVVPGYALFIAVIPLIIIQMDGMVLGWLVILSDSG